MQRRALFIVTVLAAAAPVLAVKPEEWKHEQPKDFLAGTLENVVVSSRGEVMLGHELKALHKFEDEVEVVNALARAGDGRVYAATGPSGRIYRLEGDKVSEFARLPDGGTIFSLLFTREGQLLAGTGGGEQARIFRIDGTGKATLFFEPKGAKYVWAMARGPEGQVYAATGLEGQLYVVDPDGKNGKVLTKIKPKSLLSLAIGTDGLLYAGSSDDGLVYRINPADGKPFVIYDAKESEISAIVLDSEGNVYASTASAEAARPGRTVADKSGGSPEKPAEAPKSSSTRPSGEGAGGAGDGQAEAADDAAKPSTQPALTTRPSSHGRGISRPPSEGGGNAIYRIDTNGFVTEVFREPVVILAMAEHDGTIYAGTGNEGRVYAINPAEEKVTMLAKLESAQVTALLRLSEGQLLLGAANAPALVRMSNERARKGTLLSKALDAGQITRWGRVRWEAATPSGTKLTIATRSSNVEDIESNAWDEWSSELDTSPAQIPSPAARFLQYRLTLETNAPDATPVLQSLTIPRLEENRGPDLSSVEVLPAREEAQKPTASPIVKAMLGAAAFSGGGQQQQQAGPDDYWVIKWKAEDPNKDTLTSEVYYREVGTTRWIQLAKDVKEQMKVWDTRTVEDGRYEIRIVVKDTPSNPPGTDLTAARISDPVVVDNTAPDVKIESVDTKTAKTIRVHAMIVDARTPIQEVAFSVDSNDEWTMVAADDDIFDAPREAVTFTATDVSAGEHRITIRARDAHGNTRYASRTVTVGQ